MEKRSLSASWEFGKYFLKFQTARKFRKLDHRRKVHPRQKDDFNGQNQWAEDVDFDKTTDQDDLMNAVEVLTKLELSRCWILICTLYFNISKGEVIGSVRETRSCRVESPARRSPSPESLRKQVFSQTSQCSEHRSDWRWWPWGMDSGGVNFELWFVSFDERTGARIDTKHRFSKCHMNQNPQNFPAAYRRPGNYIT